MNLLERLRRVNAPARPEESVALRVAVLVAVMAAVLAVLAEGVRSRLLAPACLIGIPAGYAVSHLLRRRDRFWTKLVLAAGAVVAFSSFLGQFSGVLRGSSNDIHVPLAELFLYVQLLHSFDVPARRDLMFSLVSSFVLMAVAGVFSLTLSLALYLAVWSVAAVTSLVLAHRSELTDAPGLTRPPSTSSRYPVARPVVATIACVLLLAPAVFFVVPSAGAARALAFPIRLVDVAAVPIAGGLANASLGDADPALAGIRLSRSARPRTSFGYFGFADSLDLAARGRPDRTLVMRVRASKPDFWRGQTFDQWDGRQWSQSDERNRVLVGRPRHDLEWIPDDAPAYRGDQFVQTFYIRRPGPNVVFGAYALSELYFADDRVFQLSDGSVRTGVRLDAGTIYTVVSRRPDVTPAKLRATETASVSSAIQRRYTQLPDVPERVRALAASVTAAAPTAFDKVLALEGWMAGHTRYSVNVPDLPAGADAVDRFLFVDRVGFCEQIGTSLVVMLRSLGIPARLVVGYLPGERNPFTGLYEVRASDAHAWAEAYFPGMGWQGFDPTARVPLAGTGGSFSAGSGLVSYLGNHLPAVPAAAVAATAFGVVGAGGLARRRRAGRRGRRSSADHRWVRVQVTRLEAVGQRRGRPPQPSETLREYVVALQRSVLPDLPVDTLLATLELEAYSGHDAGDAARRTSEAALDVVAATRREAGSAAPNVRAERAN